MEEILLRFWYSVQCRYIFPHDANRICAERSFRAGILIKVNSYSPNRTWVVLQDLFYIDWTSKGNLNVTSNRISLDLYAVISTKLGRLVWLDWTQITDNLYYIKLHRVHLTTGENTTHDFGCKYVFIRWRPWRSTMCAHHR